MRSATALPVAVAALALATGCRPDASTARGAVERFLDAHYVEIDLHSSVGFTSGLARQKVEKEIELTRGFPIDESTRRPSIHYRLIEETPAADGVARFLYEATISPPDADSFTRRWLVLARPADDGWTVTNYEELPE